MCARMTNPRRLSKFAADGDQAPTGASRRRREYSMIAAKSQSQPLFPWRLIRG
jgi:hypothetical protein